MANEINPPLLFTRKSPDLKRVATMEDLIAALPPGLSDALQMMNSKMGGLQQENQALRDSVAGHQEAVKNNTEQVSRLGVSVARLAGKFEEKIITGVCPDLAIGVADMNNSDVALVDSALPAEAVYPYTTGELATLITVHASRLGKLFKIAGIQGDHRYHCSIKIGKTSMVQKYKMRSLKALYEAALANKVPGIKPGEIALLSRCLAMLSSN